MTYVFTGPIFESPEIERIGPGQVSVPTHTFKVILVLEATHKTMYAAIVPNGEAVREPLNQFAITVDVVERRTGFDFFSGAREDSEEQDLNGAYVTFFTSRRPDNASLVLLLHNLAGSGKIPAVCDQTAAKQAVTGPKVAGQVSGCANEKGNDDTRRLA